MNNQDVDGARGSVGSNGADALGERVSGMGREAAAAAKQRADELVTGAARGAAEAASQGSDAMDSLAGSLEDSGQETLARAVGAVSHRLHDFAGYLEGRSLDALVRDARRLAQRNPALVVAGGLALGFALSRFLKASADTAAPPQNESWADYGRGSPRQTGQRANTEE